MAKIDVELSNGAKAGATLQELTKEANKLNKEISKLPIGSDDFIQKSKQLQQVSGNITQVKNDIKGTTQASDALKNAFNQFVPFSGTFGQVGQAITGAKGSVGGLTSSFGILKTAIIATGLGALVIAIVSLVAWFSKTEKGANLISGAFNAMGAVIDTLLSRMFNIGQTLKDLFSDPTKFFKNLGNDIASAAKEANSLVHEFDELEDRKRALDVADSDTEKATSRLLLQARNVKKAYQERIDLLEQADKVERESFNNRTKYLEDYLATVQREVDLAEKNGVMNDELADKLAQAQIELNKRATEQIEFEEKLQNRRSQILEQQGKDNERSLEAKRKAGAKLTKEQEEQLERELKVRQNLEDLRVEAILDQMEEELALIELDTQRKIEALTGSAEQIAEQKALLLEVEEQRLAEVRDKYAKEHADKEQKAREEKDKKDKEASDKEVELAKKTAEQKQNAEAAYMQSQSDFLQMAIDFLGQDEAARKKHATAIRVFTAGKIFVDLMREIQTIWANVAQYGPAGPAVGAVQTGMASLRAGLALKKVNAQKFAFGGWLRGPSHINGGIPFSVNGVPGFEAEGGEVLINKRSARLFRRELSQINSFNNWGRKFEAGGPINPLTPSQALAQSGADNALSGGSAGMDRLENAFMIYADKVDTWARSFKVENVVTETEDVLKTVNRIKNDASV